VCQILATVYETYIPSYLGGFLAAFLLDPTCHVAEERVVCLMEFCVDIAMGYQSVNENRRGEGDACILPVCALPSP
jgi:hypothetical protein